MTWGMADPPPGKLLVKPWWEETHRVSSTFSNVGEITRTWWSQVSHRVGGDLALIAHSNWWWRNRSTIFVYSVVLNMFACMSMSCILSLIFKFISTITNINYFYNCLVMILFSHHSVYIRHCSVFYPLSPKVARRFLRSCLWSSLPVVPYCLLLTVAPSALSQHLPSLGHEFSHWSTSTIMNAPLAILLLIATYAAAQCNQMGCGKWNQTWCFEFAYLWWIHLFILCSLTHLHELFLLFIGFSNFLCP